MVLVMIAYGAFTFLFGLGLGLCLPAPGRRPVPPAVAAPQPAEPESGGVSDALPERQSPAGDDDPTASPEMVQPEAPQPSATPAPFSNWEQPNGQAERPNRRGQNAEAGPVPPVVTPEAGAPATPEEPATSDEPPTDHDEMHDSE